MDTNTMIVWIVGISAVLIMAIVFLVLNRWGKKVTTKTPDGTEVIVETPKKTNEATGNEGNSGDIIQKWDENKFNNNKNNKFSNFHQG